MKRSAPLKRTPLRSRQEGPAFEKGEHPRAKEPKPAKERECICGNTFVPKRTEHVVCSPRCLIRKRKEDAKAERESFKGRKEAIKTIPQLVKEAQIEFNAYIRARDKDRPCICCGNPLAGAAGSTGGDFDCGHYRSVGSASHLRFDERNAHGQRKYCNRHGAGRAVDYRIGLIGRIGLREVEALEANNEPHKWTREELIAIKAHYRAKKKELEKRMEQ